MSEDEPTYATTTEDRDQLSDYVLEALRQCLEEGFVLPFIIACVAANGSVYVLRTDGENVEEIAVHTQGPGFQLPLNIMVTDSRGEATRLLITNEGMSRPN